MIRPVPRFLLAVVAAGAVGFPGCTAEEVGRTPASTASEDSTSAPASGTEVALPGLFRVMSGLEADMARVSRGLWAARLDTVAAGATAVAEHPTVPPEEAQRIASVLGEDMARFKAFDTEVHDLAVELAEAARRGDASAVLTRDAELRKGCVACHDAFRETLRDALSRPDSGQEPMP